MEIKKVAVLLTCHDRKEKTLACVRSLAEGNETKLVFAVTDAGSSDGTPEALKELGRELYTDIRVIRRGSELYWNGGMRVSLSYAYQKLKDADAILMVNDDVRFFPGAVDKLVDRMLKTEADAVAGACINSEAEQSYGGVRMKSKHFARFELIPPSEEETICDTFNCNCVLIKYECFTSCGNLDAAYVHSLGDYDYGMRLNRYGRKVVNSAEYCGECDDNPTEGSWRDNKLSRIKRLKLKESEKGLPSADWYHFLVKNYGLIPALYHSATPYLRILIGK
ncbi:MAG: glycosyltransferase family 2 protein [Lachnospiraceae bacterium]|nr:glycosyltransferase family 2 protein [Lachnospiraceae bacterium]